MSETPPRARPDPAIDPADPSLALGTRTRLPDALRTLLAEFPREAWNNHAACGPLTRFWLERHGMFRELMARMEADARLAVDGRIEPRDHAARLSRFGGLFVNQLHEHHHVEDAHYFPRLQTLDPLVARGLDILDADHHALDAQLAEFTEAANETLRAATAAGAEKDAPRDAAGRFLDHLAAFHPTLDRHLVDEEEIIVPVLLRYGEHAIG